MRPVHHIILLLVILSTPIFSQVKPDSTHSGGKNKESKLLINSTALHEYSEQVHHFNDKMEIPLNLKIYQKVLLNDYVVLRKLSSEELSTGMSEDELNSFEQNRLKTRRMLSELYGEDLIDIDSLLSAIGITREQLIGLVAILKFLLM